MHLERIRNMAFIALVTISVITAFFAAYYVLSQYRQSQKITIDQSSLFVTKAIEGMIKHYHESYGDKSKVIFSNPNVLEPLLSNDPHALKKAFEPFYRHLRTADPAFRGIRFLPLDKSHVVEISSYPKLANNENSSESLIHKALEERMPQSGCEYVGESYFFKFIHPVFVGAKQYVGVVEFGIEVRELTEDIMEHFGFDSLLLVKGAEPERSNLLATQDAYHIFESTSETLARYASLHSTALLHSEPHYTEAQKSYHIAILPLNDMQHTVYMVVAFDISPVSMSAKAFTQNVIVFLIFVVIVISIIWYKVIFYMFKLILDKESETMKNAEYLYRLSRSNPVTMLPNSLVFFEEILHEMSKLVVRNLHREKI